MDRVNAREEGGGGSLGCCRQLLCYFKDKKFNPLQDFAPKLGEGGGGGGSEEAGGGVCSAVNNLLGTSVYS